MAKAMKVYFYNAFGHFLKFHELRQLFDFYKLFLHEKIFMNFYRTTDTELQSI